MIGVIDESTPWLTDERDVVLYSIALVVISPRVADEIGVRLVANLNRKRPFHWESDLGPNVRATVTNELSSSSFALIVAAAGCRPREQAATRRSLLSRHLFPAAFDGGVTQLMIERQSRAENEADVRTVRDWSRATRRGWRPSINHVDKTEPLTWLADAASGLWSGAILDRDRVVLASIVGTQRLRSATWEPSSE